MRGRGGYKRTPAVLLLAGSVAAYVAALGSLGIWSSLAIWNTLWANLRIALILLLLGGFVIRANVASLSSYHSLLPTWREVFVEVGLSPLPAWWFASFSWNDFVSSIRQGDVLFANRLTAMLPGEVILDLVVWGFWRLACQRFRCEKTSREQGDD